MRIFVVVNDVAEIGCRQTTALLIAALVRRGGVWLTEVGQFSAASQQTQTELMVSAVELTGPQSEFRARDLEQFVRTKHQRQRVPITAADMVMIRTNPGRDPQRGPAHEAFVRWCAMAESRGTRVVNSPANLNVYASKSSIVTLDPRYRPPTLVTRDISQGIDFVNRAAKNCVAKPLVGSRGEGVVRLQPHVARNADVLKNTFGGADFVVQHFVHSDQPGDKRVLVVGGEILESGGHVAGIERHPAEYDFRANLHAGGSAHPLTLNESERQSASYAAELLGRKGIWIAGVDLIADQIIEFNVFSTGGLNDCLRFTGVPFDEIIVDKLLSTFC